MADAKLKFNDGEIVLAHGVTTIGRTTENAISFQSDSNVSRYHAEVEWRDGDFWLIDLGSSNGTTLNGEPVKSDKKLTDGDTVLLGGTSEINFSSSDEKTEETSAVANRENTDVSTNSEEPENKEAAEIEQDGAATSKAGMPKMLGIAGAVVGLAVVCAVGAVIYSNTGSSVCEAKAVIVKPDNGETLTAETEVVVESENAECAAKAIFLIGGEEFARTEEQPFTAKINPKDFPDLSNGSLYPLQIVLEDAEGNRIVQPSEVALQFETIEIAPPPKPDDAPITPSPTPIKEVKVSGGETQEMARNLLKEFSGTASYKFDPQFVQEVNKRTAEYAADGFFDRAAFYKDIISVSFVQEKNLDAPLGFILAMSRSQFKPQKNGADEGLWQMSSEFAAQNGYNGLCGAETLSDASQRCASNAASLYLKSLVLEIFEGDVIYSVAAFGKSPQEANIWKSTLPADRADFWNIIKDAKQREQVAKFFAAGIVAENPQKFGLKKDRPISDLYKTLVAK